MPIIWDYCYEHLFMTATRAFSIHRGDMNHPEYLLYSSHGEVCLPVFPERIGTAQIIFSMPVPVFMNR
ncbi:hypothetical protein MKMG_00614 [Methanogenium sp. MK-MG]|nr:hypothetical protein MKMG_00614 [Methanogenium sp. MK-MG]